MSGGVAEAPAGVKVSPLAGKPPPATLLIDPPRLEREYRDAALRAETEAGGPFVSRSEPARCQACLRKLSRSLERHEQRDRALLSLISAQADPHREGARS
jgi:hypothetical protein